MTQPATIDSRLARLNDVTMSPVAASTVPLFERRDRTRRTALQARVCNEFNEMPGTSLTVAQGARLFGLTGDICSRIFGELVRDGRLVLSADSRYRLKTAA